LAGGVEIGRGKDLSLRCLQAEFLHLLTREPQDSRHPPRAHRHCLLHKLPAQPHYPDGIREAHRLGSHQGAEFPETVAGEIVGLPPHLFPEDP